MLSTVPGLNSTVNAIPGLNIAAGITSDIFNVGYKGAKTAVGVKGGKRSKKRRVKKQRKSKKQRKTKKH